MLRRLAVAGQEIELRFASDAMLQHFFPALEHLTCRSTGDAGLTVFLWDSSADGSSAPVPPWDQDAYAPRGEVRWSAGDGELQVAYNPGSRVLSVFNGVSGEAFLWLPDVRECPSWESAAPLRTVLHWWATRAGRQLLHGAAVGDASGALLLTARGGSGKSTTALNALLAGMSYLGDDYVLAALDEAGPSVHSLYATAKVDPAAPDTVPALTQLMHDASAEAGEKVVIYLAKWKRDLLARSLPLRAVVVPGLKPGESSRLAPLKPSVAYLAMAPTTAFQLPQAREAATTFMRRLVSAVPCFRLELGDDIDAVPQLLRELLRSEEDRLSQASRRGSAR